MARPADVVLDTAANTLTITWTDGRASAYPVAYLRAWCPCAGCQGHSDTIVHRPAAAGSEVAIADMWEVGAYAVGFRFSDGHDDGIYTWKWLKAISHESKPEGPKTGRFVGGRYLPPDGSIPDGAI